MKKASKKLNRVSIEKCANGFTVEASHDFQNNKVWVFLSLRAAVEKLQMILK